MKQLSKQLGASVLAARKGGPTWYDETTFEQIGALPRKVGRGAAEGALPTIVAVKFREYLGTVSKSLSANFSLPEPAADSLAGSLGLLSAVSTVDEELRKALLTDAGRQATVFELTSLHAELLAARCLWLESFRELALEDRAVAPSVRAAVVEEAAVGVARRFSAALAGLPLSDNRPALYGWAAKEISEVVQGVRDFLLQAGPSSLLNRSDVVCDSLGIAS